MTDIESSEKISNSEILENTKPDIPLSRIPFDSLLQKLEEHGPIPLSFQSSAEETKYIREKLSIRRELERVFINSEFSLLFLLIFSNFFFFKKRQ